VIQTVVNAPPKYATSLSKLKPSGAIKIYVVHTIVINNAGIPDIQYALPS
jgi:hypothetical protein